MKSILRTLKLRLAAKWLHQLTPSYAELEKLGIDDILWTAHVYGELNKAIDKQMGCFVQNQAAQTPEEKV